MESEPLHKPQYLTLQQVHDLQQSLQHHAPAWKQHVSNMKHMLTMDYADEWVKYCNQASKTLKLGLRCSRRKHQGFDYEIIDDRLWMMAQLRYGI